MEMSQNLKEKFDCNICGCYYWVKDRNYFSCPNCEDKEYDDKKKNLNFQQKFGFLPTSVWNTPKVKDPKLEIFCSDKMGKGNLYNTYVGKDGKKKNSGSKGLSQFHPDIAKWIINFWSKKGDKILDPFAGRSRALISKTCGRDYIGFEISPIAFNLLQDKLKSQRTLFESSNIRLINEDSKNINFEEEVDLIFSCPPYWNTEDYNKLYGENVNGQLSDINDYTLFIKELGEIVKKCYKALKFDKYAVFVVNDFRRDGILIDFHSDTIKIFKEAGFRLHDIIIRKVNTMVSMKIDQCIGKKFMVKEHEYVLVFKKIKKEVI